MLILTMCKSQAASAKATATFKQNQILCYEN